MTTYWRQKFNYKFIRLPIFRYKYYFHILPGTKFVITNKKKRKKKKREESDLFMWFCAQRPKIVNTFSQTDDPFNDCSLTVQFISDFNLFPPTNCLIISPSNPITLPSQSEVRIHEQINEYIYMYLHIYEYKCKYKFTNV